MRNKNLSLTEKKRITDLEEKKQRLGKLVDELRDKVIRISNPGSDETKSIHRLSSILKKIIGKDKKEADILVVLADLIREACSRKGLEIGLCISILSNGAMHIAVDSFDFSKVPDS